MSVRAWLQLGRVSNLPTCLSNVLVGCALAAGDAPMPWVRAGLVTAAVMLLYLAGMALNDLADRRVDAVERPGRPIPSGAISPRAALVFVVVTLAGALVILATQGARAVTIGTFLVVCIIAYDLLNKRAVAAVLLMGLCRALVYLVAAAAIGLPPAAGTGTMVAYAGALFVYTTLVTFIAREEAGGTGLGARRWLALVLIVVPPAVITPERWSAWTAAAAAVAVAWLAWIARHALARPARPMHAVLGWLAGLCLVDALFLTALGHGAAALVAGGCFLATILAHRRILGT